MSENLRRYLVALAGLEHAIRNVGDDSWSNASPCEGWTVRDVAGHAVKVVATVPWRLGTGPEVNPFADHPGEFLGENPYATWCEVRDATIAALDRPGALDTVTQTPAGDMPIDAVLNTLFCDALIHSWDIARGSGGDERLDPGLVAAALPIYEQRDASGMLRVPNRYGAAADAGDGADAQSRLLAFVGRKP